MVIWAKAESPAEGLGCRISGRVEFEQALGVGEGQGSLAVLRFMGSQRVRNN